MAGTHIFGFISEGNNHSHILEQIMPQARA